MCACFGRLVSLMPCVSFWGGVLVYGSHWTMKLISSSISSYKSELSYSLCAYLISFPVFCITHINTHNIRTTKVIYIWHRVNMHERRSIWLAGVHKEKHFFFWRYSLMSTTTAFWKQTFTKLHFNKLLEMYKAVYQSCSSLLWCLLFTIWAWAKSGLKPTTHKGGCKVWTRGAQQLQNSVCLL